jgi:hypothetical protein
MTYRTTRPGLGQGYQGVIFGGNARPVRPAGRRARPRRVSG